MVISTIIRSMITSIYKMSGVVNKEPGLKLGCGNRCIGYNGLYGNFAKAVCYNTKILLVLIPSLEYSKMKYTVYKPFV